MGSPSSSLLLLSGLATFTGTGCGDDKPPVAADAKVEPKDAPSPTVDADIPNPSWDEGGGALAEYQRIFCNPNAMPPVPNCTPEGIIYQARLTTFYWKQHTPARYPFPVNPGCNKTGMETPTTDADDIFPFGMATGHHEYLDVGTPILTGGAMQATIPLGPNPGFDGFHRAQDGIYHFLVDRAGGDVYLSNYDSFYSLVLTGSSEWPPQVYKDAFYQNPSWDVVSPAFGPVQLVADTDMDIQWTTPNPATKRPADAAANMVIALIVPSIGPVVTCLTDQLSSGKFTIPKEYINYVRSFGTSGQMARAIVTHRIQELTDGTIHNHKRMDFITTWCYVVPWTAP